MAHPDAAAPASNGAATSSLPSQALFQGDEDVATPFLFSERGRYHDAPDQDSGFKGHEAAACPTRRCLDRHIIWNGTAGAAQTLRNTGLTLSRNFVSNPLNPGPSSWGSIVGLSNEQAPGPHALPVVVLVAGQRRNAWIEFTAIQKSMGSFVVGPTGPLYVPGMFNLVATGMATATAPGSPIVLGEANAFRAFRVILDAGKPRLFLRLP